MARISRRLIVTGHDAQGRSKVSSDTVISGAEQSGAWRDAEIAAMWGNDDVMCYPDDGSQPAIKHAFPMLLGSRLVELYLPARAIYLEGQQVPGAPDQPVARSEQDARPGMHRSDTMDYVIVMEGRCECELDVGRVTLAAGDVLVQSGTIHAWQNPFDEPCRFIAVMIGAKATR